MHGILNGTSNYILTQMESRGIEFEPALAEAQKEGYVEADPSFDIDGSDAQDKLCILARIRLTVKDQRGMVARVAEGITRHDINIDSLEHDPHLPKDRVSFVISVERVSEPTIRSAVDAINAFEFMVEPILLLRVEESLVPPVPPPEGRLAASSVSSASPVPSSTTPNP